MCNILTGQGGAWCNNCHATCEQENDTSEILKGFLIDRTLVAAKEMWEKQVNGEIGYNDKQRFGQTNECLLEDNARFYGILHSKLWSLNLFEKILYHLVAGVTGTWSETPLRPTFNKPYVCPYAYFVYNATGVSRLFS